MVIERRPTERISMARALMAFGFQVVAIFVVMIVLMLVLLSVVLVVFRGPSEISAIALRSDPLGIALVAAYLIPLLLGWWLYMRALQRAAARLNLDIPRGFLGIPLLGEFSFAAAIMRRYSRHS